jgi:hypothetical protein
MDKRERLSDFVGQLIDAEIEAWNSFARIGFSMQNLPEEYDEAMEVFTDLERVCVGLTAFMARMKTIKERLDGAQSDG